MECEINHAASAGPARPIPGAASSTHQTPATPPGESRQWKAVRPKGTKSQATEEARPWASFRPKDLPEFPTDALPDVLRNWVEGEAHATQTPRDMAGLFALAACSAAIAGRVRVRPRDGWEEPTNLFVVCILGPGNRKSRVFCDATQPLLDVEKMQEQQAEPVIRQAESNIRTREARLKKLEKTAAEASEHATRQRAAKEAETLAAELTQTSTPKRPRLVVEDSTPEKLEQILEEQGGRIASLSAEGGVFELMKGRYSHDGPQLEVYLKGHAGDRIVTDRVNRPMVRIDRPALTCAYAVQPVVMNDLLSNRAFRGRGLLARFLFAAPRSPVGSREIAPPSLSQASGDAYRKLVHGLASSESAITLPFDKQAERLLFEWEGEVENMLGPGGELQHVQDWAGKLVGATVRLAGVLHCVEHGKQEDGRIGERTVEHAIAIGRYLIPHAQKVLDILDSSLTDDAWRIRRWIERNSLETFSARDVQQAFKRKHSPASIVGPLDELEERGMIRKVVQTNDGKRAGRPPSQPYEVNPQLHQGVAPVTEPDSHR